MSRTVWTRPLGGRWEPLGVDRAGGIYPEGLALAADDWGSAGLDAELRRNPSVLHPDLAAFTPYEVEVDGLPVGIGDLWETPARGGFDPALAISGRGRQGNLDDDVYEKTYIHGRLADWFDIREHPSAVLTTFTLPPQVTVGTAQILMDNTPSGTGGTEAVILDTGTGGAKTVVCTYIGGGGTGSLTMYGADTVADIATANGETVTIDATPVATSITTTTVSFTNGPWRYVAVSFNGSAGAAWVAISKLLVASASAYISSNVSALKASTVVGDALTRAPVIGQSTSKIATTSYDIPHITTEGQSSPREVMERVKAFEDPQIRVTMENELQLRTRPTAPLFEVGDWPGAAEFEDSSMNSGEEIFNAAVIEGQDVNSTALSTRRDGVNVTPLTLAKAQLSNGTFPGNVTGWTFTQLSGSGGSFAHNGGTGEMIPSTPGAGSGKAEATVTGLTPGAMYLLDVGNTLRFPGATSATIEVVGCGLAVPIPISVGRPRVIFVAATGTETVRLTATGTGGAGSAVSIDNLVIYADPSLAGRGGATRTQIINPAGSVSTTDAQTLADLFLTNHRRAPFRGELQVTGADAVRWVLGGQGVHPALFQRYVGEKIRFSNMVDPDTGEMGRDVYIAAASYDADSGTASLTLDNTSTKFEQQLARIDAKV